MPEHVCPWWIGYLLVSPLRRLFYKPELIVAPFAKEGMTVLEVGPGMGFFTLPMARFVGADGKIICIDVQEKMIKSLMRRAAGAGLSDRIITRITSGNSLHVEDFTNCVDFALLFAVVHEVSNQEKLFREIYTTLKAGSLVLLSEPKGHVTLEDFNQTLKIAKQIGYDVIASPDIKRSHSAVLRKNKNLGNV
ncbi:MAG: class I SAM-dependent methyltransferase [Ignavibacteriales bacterium]|nr:class I SAM-dependent methyltransferase [Ignavibacteriales bacterium]